MATSSLTLYEIEESLQALLDSEALITPEQEAEFRAELAAHMLVSVKKRDRVAAFIQHCEYLADTATLERKRLKAREEFFERTAERVRDYVGRVIEGMGRDERGKWRKLEGELNTFSLRANPAHVEIEDATAIPSEFKTANLRVSQDRLNEFLASIICEKDWVSINKEDGTATIPLTLWRDVAALAVWMQSSRCDWEVSKSAVKAAIEAGREVPGASLVLGGNRVEIK